MTKPGVYFIVDLAIAGGKLEAFQTIAQSMVEGTQQEPGALAYEFYFDNSRKKCRLIEIYSDSDAALARVVQELVPKLLEVSSLTGFSVYGDLTTEAEQLLTQIGAQLYSSSCGFNRF
ncbi:MAG TPA: antibiotic biosynthesis monooxygenase [Pyrinomonadaceae bacterium]|nr:antibiotic biosynthesis monooxygenase [Pyrinomonadaceae bacterium]